MQNNNISANLSERPRFTEEMRKDYTIPVPNMLPVQLGLMCRLMKNYGYNMELPRHRRPEHRGAGSAQRA